MRQVALRLERHDGVPATQMVFQVVRHGGRDRMVFCGLDYETGHPDKAQKLPQVAVEDGPRNEERDIGAHVEKGPAELSDGGWHVGSNG